MSDPTGPVDPDILEDEGVPEEQGLETPDADLAEQHLEVVQRGDEPLEGRDLLEVDPADAAEQHRVVELDEDDYRP